MPGIFGGASLTRRDSFGGHVVFLPIVQKNHREGGGLRVFSYRDGQKTKSGFVENFSHRPRFWDHSIFFLNI